MVQIRFDQPMNRNTVTAVGTISVSPINVAPGWTAVYQDYTWLDNQTISFVLNAANANPMESFPASTTITIAVSAAAANPSGETLAAPYQWSFTTKAGAISSANAGMSLTTAYQAHFGQHVPDPAYSYNAPGAAWPRFWTSTAYIGSQLYRLYLLEDGTILFRNFQPAHRPYGTIRVAVVAIDYGNTNIGSVLQNLWMAAQNSVNAAYAQVSPPPGWPQPLVQFTNTNILAQSSQVSNPSDQNSIISFLTSKGYSASDFDVYVSLSLDPSHPAGGFESGNFIFMGYYFGAANYVTLDAGTLLDLAGSVYDHEMGHVFGWEHEWTPNYPAASPNPITDPILYGWRDTDGDGTPEIIDPTPYGNTCAYTVWPLNLAIAATGGQGNISVTTQAGCAWSTTSNAAWITVGSQTAASVSYSATANAGSMRSGTLTVAGQTVIVTQAANNLGQGPGLVSLNPFQGYGPNTILTLVYAHPNGWPAIKSAEFIMNPRWEAAQRSGGCYVKYAPGTGLFTLIADDGNGVAGTTTPGSSANISNSQCTLNASGSSASGNGNSLTLVVALTFSASFGGQRHIWMQASDYNNLSTNWLVYGVWFPTQTSVTAGPWYRIYDPFSNSFLYSADTNEYNTLGARGFVQQGISGLAMNGPTTVGGTSNIAWYRVYVNSTNSHFWTSDRNEFLTLINQQQAYVGEGVAAFVMPYINAVGQVSPQVTNTIPFWRAAFQGANLHFWTSDPNEYNGTNGKQLPPGYKGEGIACYIFPASGPVGIGTSAQFNDGTAMLTEDDGIPAVVSVVNGASYVSNGVIAPGQTLTVYGRHLAGRVLLNRAPAQLIRTQDHEIQVVAPYNLVPGAEATLEVEHQGRRSKPLTLSVVASDPAIFGTNQYGKGIAQAHNEDGTSNGSEHPAARGSVVTFYVTGVGLSDMPVEVHIAGQPAEVTSTQVSGTRPGVIEVQIRVPETVEPAPFQPVLLHVGNLFSQPGVGLAIR
jgi:uncharacterized protein (TIGR03437 family)